jgi:hypothetical protein
MGGGGGEGIMCNEAITFWQNVIQMTSDCGCISFEDFGKFSVTCFRGVSLIERLVRSKMDRLWWCSVNNNGLR